MKDPEEIFVVVYQTDHLSHPDGHYFDDYDKALKQARYEDPLGLSCRNAQR